MPKKNLAAATISLGDNGKTIRADLDELNEILKGEVKFPASLFKVTINADGSARLQLDVPRSALGDVVQMSALTEALLEVSVTVKAKQGTFPMNGGAEDESDEE